MPTILGAMRRCGGHGPPYGYHPRFAGTPTVLFGPGVHDTCHSSVEYVPIDSITDCAKVAAAYLYEQLKR